MGADGTATEPLTRAEFYALYRGGLSFDTEQRRLTASYVLLASGRLGLRPDEVVHLHEDWIDWEAGEITIPAHDPCACAECWSQAQKAGKRGDGRSVSEIVTADQWHPVEDGARTVPFGWSYRITATLATVLDRHEWFEHDTDHVGKLLGAATDRAEGLDPDAVDVETLRATAGRFFAEAGCDTEAIANVLGIDDARARKYARQWGSETTTGLATRLGDGTVPQPARQFPIACDPTPFDREPFDATAFDADWRLDRATDRVGEHRLLETPRPADPPGGVTYDPRGHDLPTHLHENSAHVVQGDQTTPTASSLPEWLLEAERKRGGALAAAEPDTASASTGQQPSTPSTPSGGASGGTGGTTADTSSEDDTTTGSVGSGTMSPRDQVTEPIVEEVSTRFAAADLAGGSPVTGEAVLGQEELLYVTDDGELCLSLENVIDVAVDYTPSGLEDAFDSTVGVSYKRNGDSRLSVVELPGKKQHDFASGMLRLLLDGNQVTVTHPARKGGRVTDAEAEDFTLSVDSRQIKFKSGAGAEFRIRLSDLIHIERGKQAVRGVTHKALLVRHCTTDDGEPVTTEISAATDREFKLLERYLMRDYERRKKKLQQISLSDAEKEILVAMYSLGSAMDVSMVMDISSEKLTKLVNSLKGHGLVQDNGDGNELTGMGQMVVSDKVDDINI